MIIPYSSSLVAQNRNGQQLFEECGDPFVFQRKIITNLYEEMPEMVFKVYVYLCKYCRSTDGGGYLAGDVFRGIDTIRKELNMTQYAVQTAMDWLETNYFIMDTGIKKKSKTALKGVHVWRVLVAPDCLKGASQPFYPCNHTERTTYSLKQHNHGYIMLPHELFNHDVLSGKVKTKANATSPVWKQAIWKQREIKILMLLYAHCWLNYFGGIDPHIVQIDSNGNITLHDSLCYDLKSRPELITRTVISLMKAGLFVPVRCVIRQSGFEEFKYAGDESVISTQPDDTVITILRPRFIFAKQLDDYNLRGMMCL